MQYLTTFLVQLYNYGVNMRLFFTLLLFLSSLFADEAAYNRGEIIYFSKGCTSCHGPAAEGSSSYPALAHKKEAYLEKKLKYFRAGKVDSVSKQMMSQFARKLSNQDIQDLVVFLAHHKDVEIEDVSDDILGGFGS